MMADKNQRYQASFKGCQRQLILSYKLSIFTIIYFWKLVTGNLSLNY